MWGAGWNPVYAQPKARSMTAGTTKRGCGDGSTEKALTCAREIRRRGSLRCGLQRQSQVEVRRCKARGLESRVRTRAKGTVYVNQKTSHLPIWV